MANPVGRNAPLPFSSTVQPVVFSVGGSSVSAGVFLPVPGWPLTQDLDVDNYIADFGDGFEQRANFNLAYTRADGEGTVSSYKGRNRFTFSFTSRQFAADAKTIWHWYKQMGGNLTAFYVYNVPLERATADGTGVDTTGRYLVRFEQPRLTRENFTTLLFNSQISVIETRG